MRALFLFLSVSLAAAPVSFKILEAGIGSMTISDDGKYAFAAHSADDQVTVWELAPMRTPQKVATLTTVSPHYLMSRGKSLYVLGFRSAAVQVYDIPSWKLQATHPVKAQAPVMLTAARGPHFRGELLIAAGEYNSRRLMLLDLESGEVTRVNGSGAAAQVDFTGKRLLIQGEFGHSPRSGSLFRYDSIRDDKLHRLSQNASSRYSIFQPRPVPFWVDNSNIYNNEAGRLSEMGSLIPDHTRNLIYVFRDGQMHAHRLADGFALVEKREVKSGFSPDYQSGGGRLAYHFRRAIGVTVGERLHLLAYDRDNKSYVYAQTAALPTGDDEAAELAESAKPTPIVDSIIAGERAHRRALAEAQAELLAAFEAEMKRIAKTGDLDGIDAHQARVLAYKDHGKLPMTPTLFPASAAHEAARKAAHIALTQVYSEAIIALTKELRIAEARALRDKRDALVAESAAIIDHAHLEGGFRELRIGEDIPDFLRASADALIDESGLIAGSLRSPQGDYIARDFVLDAVVGDSARLRLGDQLTVETDGGHARVRVGDRQIVKLGTQNSERHLLRIERRGGSLIAGWTANFAGSFVPDGSHLVVNVAETLPKLTDKNSFLTLSGQIKALRLAESGDLRTAPQKAPAWSQLHGGWHALTNRGGQPEFMRGSARNIADSNGLKGNLRTHAGDYLTRDFILDVRTMGDSDVHFGQANDAVVVRIRGGLVELVVANQRARRIGQLYTEDAHTLRIAKSAQAITIGLADAKDDPISAVISLPRLSDAIPGLNIHNGFLGVNGLIAGLRLAVDGKPIPPAKAPKFEHPTRMSPQAILNPGAKNAPHFAATDLATRDFVFDLQYRFAPNSQAVLVAGLKGSSGSLLTRLHGEGHRGGSYIAFGHSDPNYGRVPGPGPHWLRVSKVGSTLTYAIAVNHGEEFEPFYSTTIPDIVTAVPSFANGIAEIHYSGGDELLAAQLLIDGKPATRAFSGSSLRVADSEVTVPTRATVGKALKAELVAKGKAKLELLAGPEGLSVSRGTLKWKPEAAGTFPVRLKVIVGEVETELSAEITARDE